MAAIVDTLKNAFTKIGDTATAIGTKVLPVVQDSTQAVKSAVQTVTKGKMPTNAPTQNPSRVEEEQLVPRNVGGLDLGTGINISGTMLVIGIVAVALIFYARKK